MDRIRKTNDHARSSKKKLAQKKFHRNESFAWIQQVKSAIESHAKNDTYLVGVSGGLDSRVLLALLLEIGFRHLVVCHLNHNLRESESSKDCQFVNRISRRLGLKFYTEKLSELPDAGSLETSARVARLNFFAHASEKFGTSRVFLGHHADDQVETFLFNLFRGSASFENAAMKPQSKIATYNGELTLLRPLLQISKENLRLFAAKRRLTFREDSTNESRKMTRNRIRLDLIPAIENALDRPIRPALLRAIDVAIAESDFIRSHVPDLSNSRELPVRQMREMPVAIQRRVIHAWLKQQNVKQFGFEEVEQVRSLLIATKIAKINLPSGTFCRRRSGLLFLERMTKINPSGSRPSAST
jgi:tRNA(Ile)-lysidine synthetase-like protein